MFSKKNLTKIFNMMLVLVLSALLSSCSYGILEPVDYGKAYDVIGADFEYPEMDKYMINKVLFTVRILENNPRNYEKGMFQRFRLYIMAYKSGSNTSTVKINSVKIEGAGDIKFAEISKDIDEQLIFKQDSENENLVDSSILLFEEITDENMYLNDESQLKVLVNVTVEENGEKITQDIEFIIECDTFPAIERFFYIT